MFTMGVPVRARRFCKTANASEVVSPQHARRTGCPARRATGVVPSRSMQARTGCERQMFEPSTPWHTHRLLIPCTNFPFRVVRKKEPTATGGGHAPLCPPGVTLCVKRTNNDQAEQNRLFFFASSLHPSEHCQCYTRGREGGSSNPGNVFNRLFISHDPDPPEGALPKRSNGNSVCVGLGLART